MEGNEGHSDSKEDGLEKIPVVRQSLRRETTDASVVFAASAESVMRSRSRN